MSAQTSIEAMKKQSTSNTTSTSNPTDTRIANPHNASNHETHKRIFLLCHYFARRKQLWENECYHLGRNEMAGLKGKSGPPGNMNAFKHGLAAIQKRREERNFLRAGGECQAANSGEGLSADARSGTIIRSF
jgi:hypothetical protein